ncbi:MAG: hypothetical protein ACOZNI_16490 [Myxococcota bacterium]
MERASRLRRYLRKDYTQLVEFPVEIVGRDGHVRRYSFDDSVRLYQRRIHSAPMRYDDPDLIDAEVRHCRQRIDQLRRSYLEHHGWGALREGQLPGVFSGPLAAEVAAFLRRAFPDRPVPLSLAMTALDGAAGEACYLQDTTAERAYVLYAWRFEGRAGARELFRDTWRRLVAAPSAEGVERLFYAHEGGDIGLLLAGTGEWNGPVPVLADGNGVHDDVDPWAAGVRALYDGGVTEALRIFEAGLEADPARPALAQAAALVALLDDQAERAEFAARHGLLLHPTDRRLVYLLCVALARQGRAVEAQARVAGLDERDRTETLLSVLTAVLALAGGDVRGALAAVRAARAAHPGETRFEARALSVLKRDLARRAAVVVAGGVAVVAGLVAGEPFGWGAAVVGALTPAWAWWSARRGARRALAGHRDARPRLLSPELLPRDRAGDLDQ